VRLEKVFHATLAFVEKRRKAKAAKAAEALLPPPPAPAAAVAAKAAPVVDINPTNAMIHPWERKAPVVKEPLKSRLDLPPCEGLYIWGDVGTGKSMLGDLFFDCIKRHVPKARRVHYHSFMQQDVHLRLHKLGGGSKIPELAELLADECDGVICFDEFQVADIADAFLTKRLFEHLFAEHQVVLVATSNRHPDMLYESGMNYPLFSPFIPYLLENVNVARLESPEDYRRRKFEGREAVKIESDAERGLQIRALADGPLVDVEIDLTFGRVITIACHVPPTTTTTTSTTTTTTTANNTTLPTGVLSFERFDHLQMGPNCCKGLADNLDVTRLKAPALLAAARTALLRSLLTLLTLVVT
jgi:predicted ATPase